MAYDIEMKVAKQIWLKVLSGIKNSKTPILWFLTPSLKSFYNSKKHNSKMMESSSSKLTNLALSSLLSAINLHLLKGNLPFGTRTKFNQQNSCYESILASIAHRRVYIETPLGHHKFRVNFKSSRQELTVTTSIAGEISW